MSKFTFEKKLEMVQRYLNNKGGYKSPVKNTEFRIISLKNGFYSINIMVRKGLLKAIQTIQFSLN